MRRRALAPVAVSALLLGTTTGCGEIETLALSERPSRADFDEVVHPLLIEMGCSRNGRCHTIVSGELRLDPVRTPATLDQDFLLVQGFIDLDEPAASPLLTTVLQGTDSTHRPPFCFRSTQDCAYRKVLAWIAWSGPDDPRPQDIDCDLAGEGCP